MSSKSSLATPNIKDWMFLGVEHRDHGREAGLGSRLSRANLGVGIGGRRGLNSMAWVGHISRNGERGIMHPFIRMKSLAYSHAIDIVLNCT